MYYQDSFYTQTQALKDEQVSKWREAAKKWQKIERTEDANACLFIAESIEKGDRFRSLVQQKLRDAGLPDDQPICPTLDKILRKAHQEVYLENTEKQV